MRDDDAAASLVGLDEDRGGGGGVEGRERGAERVDGRCIVFARVRKEGGGIRKLTRKRLAEPWNARTEKGSVTKPVVGTVEGGHAGSSGGVDGGFEGAFHVFKAGVSKETFAGSANPSPEREVAQGLAQFDLEAGGVDIAHRVKKGARLAAEGLGSGTMTESRDAEGAGQIDEAVAINVPDVDAVRTFPKDRPVRGNEGGVVALGATEAHRQCQGAGAGDFGDQIGKHDGVGGRVDPDAA